MTALKSLKQLIAASEVNGLFGMRPHKAFDQAQPYGECAVTNSYNYTAGNGTRAKLPVQAHSLMTAFELKKAICHELSLRQVEGIDQLVQEEVPHPSSLQIVINKLTDRTVHDSENGSLLSEFWFT